jgi:hypothetical protein
MAQKNMIELIHSLYDLNNLDDMSLSSLYLTVENLSHHHTDDFIAVFNYLDKEIKDEKKYTFYSSTLFQAIQNLHKNHRTKTEHWQSFCILLKQHWNHVSVEDKNRILNQLHKHSFNLQQCIEKLLKQDCFFMNFCENPAIYYQGLLVLLKKWDNPTKLSFTTLPNIHLNQALYLELPDGKQSGELVDDREKYFHWLSSRYPHILFSEVNAIFFTHIESSVTAFHIIDHLLDYGFKKWSECLNINQQNNVLFNHFLNIAFFVARKFPAHFYLLFNHINLVSLLFKDYYHPYQHDSINLNDFFLYYAQADIDGFIKNILSLDSQYYLHSRLKILLSYLIESFSRQSFSFKNNNHIHDFISLIKLHEIVLYIQHNTLVDSRELNRYTAQCLRKQYNIAYSKHIHAIFLEYETDQTSWILSNDLEKIQNDEDEEPVFKI